MVRDTKRCWDLFVCSSSCFMPIPQQWCILELWLLYKAKVLPYSLPSVGVDPCVQAVSPQVTVIHPVVGCHYFPPGLRLPFQLKSVTTHWPVLNYTAWSQRHIMWAACPRLLPGSGPAEIWTHDFWIVSECSTVMPHRPHNRKSFARTWTNWSVWPYARWLYVLAGCISFRPEIPYCYYYYCDFLPWE